MTLKDWLVTHGKYNGPELESFSASIGVTRRSLYRYMSGEVRPRWDVIDRVKQATSGAVTPNDWADAKSVEAA